MLNLHPEKWTFFFPEMSTHVVFEIIDYNRPLLSEHKSQELPATCTHTFNIRAITPYIPHALLDHVSSHRIPLHLIYPVLTQTSSYVASPFSQHEIHITETAAAMEDLFSLLQPRFAKIY